MGMKLFVGSLSHNATNQDLEEAFAPFGTVVSAVVISDRETRQSKGFGFVEMSTDAEAKNAIQGLDGKEIMGRNVAVNEARPRDDNRSSRPPGRGFSGGGGGGGGGRGGSGGGGGRY